MLNRRFLHLIVVILFAALVGTLASAQAAQVVHICVAPYIATPYLITLRSTELFGLVVPEEAEITVYSDETLVTTSVFSIITDANTGAYRRKDKVTTSLTIPDLPIARACKNEYPDIVTDTLRATIPLPVSPDYVLLVQVVGDDQLETAPFLGTFSFHFRPLLGTSQRNFQLIQMSDSTIGIEVSFPFLTDDSTRFVLVANKEFAVRRSFKGDDQNFSSGYPADERPFLINALNSVGLNLYQLLQEGNARIFPSNGVIFDYPLGGFLHLDISPIAAAREPGFNQGDTIHAIDGERFDYAIPDKPEERVGALDRAEVVLVDETGRLIVQFSGGPEVVVMRPWLVEVELQ